jgi:hypothetical protein
MCILMLDFVEILQAPTAANWFMTHSSTLAGVDRRKIACSNGREFLLRLNLI